MSPADPPDDDLVSLMLDVAALDFDRRAARLRAEALAMEPDFVGPLTRSDRAYRKQARAEAAKLIDRAEIFEARAEVARTGVLLFGVDEREDPEFLSGWRALISHCRDRDRIVYPPRAIALLGRIRQLLAYAR